MSAIEPTPGDRRIGKSVRLSDALAKTAHGELLAMRPDTNITARDLATAFAAACVHHAVLITEM